jgi:uncharacterized membrane protein (DUF485 family)
MPGFDSGPAAPEPHDIPTARRNSRYGLILFTIYLTIYAAFVLLNAFRPDLMDRTLSGLNVATLYGFGLIAAALLLAALYGWLCRAPEAAP